MPMTVNPRYTLSLGLSACVTALYSGAVTELCCPGPVQRSCQKDTVGAGVAYFLEAVMQKEKGGWVVSSVTYLPNWFPCWAMSF